jgi:cytochrome c oxidase subunit 3
MEKDELTYDEKSARSKKLLLWFAIISMVMVFAGLTSGFIVSKSRPDWKPVELPSQFLYSTIIIVLSSITFWFAKKSISANQIKKTTYFLTATLVLGVLFVSQQFQGFNEMVAKGQFLTGPTSNITSQFLYAFVMVHLAHLAGGLLSLIVTLINQLRGKYTAQNYLGIELSSMFWHFLDILWLYLFFFLYFIK